MYCGKCGTQNVDGAVFCASCGARMNEVQPEITTINEMDLNARNRKVGILAVVVVGIVAIIAALLIFGGSSYEKTLKNYYRAYEKNDADLMYDSVIAQYWIDYMNDGWGNSAYESIQDSIEDSIEEWDCGDDIKISYKIRSEKRATKEQLRDLEDNIYDWYAYYVYDRDEFSITDAYVLDIDFTVRGDDGTENLHYPDGLLIIKENGKWRIPRGSISCSFYDNQ